MKKKEKVKILTTYGITTLILLISIGTSFGLYRLFIKGTDTGIQGTSAEFFPAQQQQKSSQSFSFPAHDLLLETELDEYINASDLVPIKTYEIEEFAEKSYFRVTNPTNSSKLYSINLVDLFISQNLQVEDFRWQIYNKNTDEVLECGTFQNVYKSTYTLVSGISIPDYFAHEYILRIWIDETPGDQSSLLNGSFSGKISIESKSTEKLQIR